MAEVEEFFSTPEMTLRVDLVRHLIENSELVPLVRGPSGIGKSAMATRLQELAPDNWVVCHFSADSMMQPERLLANIARCQGLPESPSGMLARLEEHFSLLRKRGTTPVLLVDDAQALPPTSLITLLRLYERQVGGAPLISLVLFADEQIDMLLSTPQLQVMSPQSIQVIDLPPLTRDEADDFMRHLLQSEGLSDRFILDPARLNRIYREAQGIPGRLSSAILAAVGEEGEAPQASAWPSARRFLMLGVPLFAMIALILLFQDQINALFAPAEAPSRTAGVSEPRLTPSMEVRREVVEAPPVAFVAPPLPPAGDRAAPESTSPSEAGPGPQTQQQQSTGEPSPPLQVAGVAEKSAGDSLVGEGEEAAAVGGGLPAVLPLVGAPQSPAAAQPEVEPAPVGSLPLEPPPGEAVSLEKPEQREAPSSQQSAPRVEELLKDDDWLASQVQGSFTIQLLGAEKIESMQTLLDHYAVGHKAFAVESRRSGKPWYSLLYGVYPDGQAALAGLRELPADLQKSGAWARSIASLRR